MKLQAISLLFAACLLAISCSEKAPPDSNVTEADRPRDTGALATASKEDSGGEDEDEKPEADMIGEDCVAFVRATIALLPEAAPAHCPQCPAAAPAPEVLKFDKVEINRFTPSGGGFDVAVRILATFNPSRGGTIAGGLTGWISPEQRAQYARGETPTGQQVYNVNVSYRRTARGWHAAEFN